LGAARSQQRRLRLRHAADKRRPGEQRRPGHEQPPAPEAVGEAPAQQQEPAEDEGVGVEHPQQVLLGEAEVALDRRQGDVHDRRLDRRQGDVHDRRVEASFAGGETSSSDLGDPCACDAALIRYGGAPLEPLETGIDHVRGPDAAAVILEYGDYECPYSHVALREIERVERAAKGQVRFAYRHFPLAQIHPHALGAAAA
jgi:hypothetical protein